jgi:superfamily II DNA helicase RecQ
VAPPWAGIGLLHDDTEPVRAARAEPFAPVERSAHHGAAQIGAHQIGGEQRVPEARQIGGGTAQAAAGALELGIHAGARIADARRKVAEGKGASSDRSHPARDLSSADTPLYDALVEWRRRISKASGAPAYVVFHDATLVAVVEAKPSTRRDLLALAGIGPVKVERYGDDVLALVAAHVAGR